VDLILTGPNRLKKLYDNVIWTGQASRQSSREILRKLFDIINEPHRFAKTFLSRSISDPLIIQKIIDSGYDLSQPDHKNLTPLQAICSYHQTSAGLQSLRLLIENGAQIDIPDNTNSALAQAIIRRSKSMSFYLLDNGANFESALHFLPNQRLHAMNFNRKYQKLLSSYRLSWLRFWYLLSQNRVSIKPNLELSSVLYHLYYRRTLDLLQYIIQSLPLTWEIILKSKKVA